MATLIDTPPDKIKRTGRGQYLFYFASGKNVLTLPVGSEYRVVYSPSGYNRRWEVVSYRVVPGQVWATAVQVLEERELTAQEIAHFKRLIEEYQAR